MTGRATAARGGGPEKDPFPIRASLDGVELGSGDVRDAELARARHALAHLKARIGNAAMRELLWDDVEATTRQAREWAAASDGRWRTGVAELVVPGPTASDFHAWYSRTMGERREAALRAGHPEHFVLHPGEDGIEVVENIGETDLPWSVRYRSLPEGRFPMPWDDGYPVRFGAEIVDDGGVRVGFTMHQARDADDGMHLRLRTLLPEAAPVELVERHLRHFAIEFSNWTRAAWREQREAEA